MTEISPQERLVFLQKKWAEHEELARQLLREEVPNPYREIDVPSWISRAQKQDLEEWQKSREYAYAFNESMLRDERDQIIPGRFLFGHLQSLLQHISKAVREGNYDRNMKFQPYISPDGLAPSHPVRLYCDRRAIWKTQEWISDGRPTLQDLLERRGLYKLPDKRYIADSSPTECPF